MHFLMWKQTPQKILLTVPFLLISWLRCIFRSWNFQKIWFYFLNTFSVSVWRWGDITSINLIFYLGKQLAIEILKLSKGRWGGPENSFGKHFVHLSAPSHTSLMLAKLCVMVFFLAKEFAGLVWLCTVGKIECQKHCKFSLHFISFFD